MATGLDLVKKAVNPGYYAGKAGAAFAAVDIASVATADSKFKALLETLKNLVAFNLFGWAGIVTGAFVGISGVIKSVIRDSGSLAAALQRLSQIQVYQAQFEPFVKSAAAARARVAELVKETQRLGVFKLGELVNSARTLEALTRGAFSGTAALRKLTDAAAASSNGIEDVTGPAALLVRELQDGKPIEASVDALAQMGVISQQTARNLSEMQQRGATASDTLRAFEAALDKSAGAGERASHSIAGLEGRYAEAKSALNSAFTDNFLASEQKGIENTISVMVNLAPAAKAVGSAIAQVVDIGSNFTSGLAKWLTGIPGVTLVLSGFVKIVVDLGAAMAALTFVRALGYLVQFGRAFTAVGVQAGVFRVEMLALNAAMNASAAGYTRTGNALLSLSNGLSGARAGVGKLTSSLGGILAMTGIGLIIAGVVSALVGLWTSYEEHQKELADMKKATTEMTNSLRDQIDAMQTLDDRQQALIESTRTLAEERAKLAKLRADGAPGDTQAAQADRVRQFRELRDRARNASGLAPDREERALLETRARAELAAREASYQARLSNASPDEQLRMEREKQAQETAKEAQGKGLQDERLRVSKEQRELDHDITDARAGAANFNPATDGVRLTQLEGEYNRRRDAASKAGRRFNGTLSGSDAVELGALKERRAAYEELQKLEEKRSQIALQSTNQIVAGLAQVDAAEKSGAMKHDEAAKRRLELTIQQQDLEENLARRQEEIIARTARLEQMKREERLRDRQKESETEDRSIQRMRSRAAALAARGQFGASGDLIAQAREAERARLNADSYRQKVDQQRLSPEDARARVADEDRTRQQQLADQASAFRAQQDRALREGQLSLGNRAADRREARALADEDKARERIAEALNAGLNPKEASEYALKAAKQDFQRDQKEQAGNAVADSLQRIAGGGGVGAGDPMLSIAQRQADLQQRILDALQRNQPPSGVSSPSVDFPGNN